METRTRAGACQVKGEKGPGLATITTLQPQGDRVNTVKDNDVENKTFPLFLVVKNVQKMNDVFIMYLYFPKRHQKI